MSAVSKLGGGGGGSTPSLQAVTDVGHTTTNDLTANSFTGNGAALTSLPIPTLQQITSAGGDSTTDAIRVGLLITTAIEAFEGAGITVNADGSLSMPGAPHFDRVPGTDAPTPAPIGTLATSQVGDAESGTGLVLGKPSIWFLMRNQGADYLVPGYLYTPV